jgi:4-carboxymuconolactone decarboxylase
MDSRFEWAAPEPAAIEAGVAAQTIDVVRFKKPTDGLGETEVLIIEFGRQLFRERRVDADRFAAARALFGDRGIVDFVVLMTQYSATALVLAAFDMQPKAGLDFDLPAL